MKKQKGIVLLPILIAVVILGVIGYILLTNYLSVRQYNNQNRINKSAITPTISSPRPKSSFTLIETKVDNRTNERVCKSESLGLSLTLPSVEWLCSGKDYENGNGEIEISSGVINIRLNNLGRGVYCHTQANLDPDNKCSVKIYFENEKIILDLYEYEGERKEMFGLLTYHTLEDSKTHMSITYNDMETTLLSDRDRNELFTLLDSIVFDK